MLRVESTKGAFQHRHALAGLLSDRIGIAQQGLEKGRTNLGGVLAHAGQSRVGIGNLFVGCGPPLHPRMLQDLLCRQPLFGIILHQPLNELNGVFRQVFRVFMIAQWKLVSTKDSFFYFFCRGVTVEIKGVGA